MLRPWTIALAAAWVWAFTCAAVAAPYRPAHDSDVLEQLPWRAEGRDDRLTRALRTLLARDPKNLDVALRLAQVYVDRARTESDPRQLGHAQAVLAPWWDEADPAVPVLLLRATIRQSGHQFPAARADLERAVSREPGDAQAWLTLATVQQVTGDFDSAAKSCERVTSVGAASIGAICAAALQGVSGHASEAYASVSAWLAQPGAARESVGVRSWALTLAAELADRLGKSAEAETWYRASLAVDPADAYTIGAYADFLLDAGRPAEVVPLIAADTPVDVLLLRRALADRQLKSPDAAKTEVDLAERFAALRERGDRVHLREEARYTLALKNDPRAALDLALQDFAVQKEPLDARIALESALAAKQPDAVAEIARWIAQTRLQGERLQSLRRDVERR